MVAMTVHIGANRHRDGRFGAVTEGGFEVAKRSVQVEALVCDLDGKQVGSAGPGEPRIRGTGSRAIRVGQHPTTLQVLRANEAQRISIGAHGVEFTGDHPPPVWLFGPG